MNTTNDPWPPPAAPPINATSLTESGTVRFYAGGSPPPPEPRGRFPWVWLALAIITALVITAVALVALVTSDSDSAAGTAGVATAIEAPAFTSPGTVVEIARDEYIWFTGIDDDVLIESFTADERELFGAMETLCLTLNDPNNTATLAEMASAAGQAVALNPEADSGDIAAVSAMMTQFCVRGSK